MAARRLHAGVAVPANDRRRLERLCWYVGRPPVASERLSELTDGRLLYELPPTLGDRGSCQAP